jgi:uncharacterized protein
MKIKMGEYNTLKVSKLLRMGAYLKAGVQDKEEILLPKNQMPDNLKEGDSLRVFVYRDSEDRPIATLKTPIAQVGEVAHLKAVSITKIGAFFDWGLEKDVFMPIKEITYKIVPGNKYLVALYLDRSDRVCATSRVFNYLKEGGPFKVDDSIEGIVYNVVEDIGAFVAVDNKYSALIPKTEAYRTLSPGDRVSAKVVRILEDGKLTLSIKKTNHKKISNEAQKILGVLQHHKGFLPINDDSSPEAIKLRLGLSKSMFKKALGNLLRMNMVEQIKEGIRLKPEKEQKDSEVKDRSVRKVSSDRRPSQTRTKDSSPRSKSREGSKKTNRKKSAPRVR